MSLEQIDVRHTASLTDAERRAIRVLLDDAFADGVTDDDFEHALGGMHALLWEGSKPIAHGSVIMRRLVHNGKAIRTGYVEAVAVRPDRRRRGHAHQVMAVLEEIIRAAYQLGALGSSQMALGFYASRGWQPWRGTISIVTPTGIVRIPEGEDAIYVFPVTAALNWTGDLACDWRNGDAW